MGATRLATRRGRCAAGWCEASVICVRGRERWVRRNLRRGVPGVRPELMRGVRDLRAGGRLVWCVIHLCAGARDVVWVTFGTGRAG